MDDLLSENTNATKYDDALTKFEYGEDGTSYVYKSGETYDGTDKFINNAVFMLNEMRKADAVLLGPAIVKIAGEKEPLVAVFAHEFGHAFDAFCGNHFLYDKTKAQKEDGYDRWVGNKHEAMSIIFENIMRAIYNVNGRTEYYGKSTYKQ